MRVSVVYVYVNTAHEYICMHVFVYVCMYVYVYVCIHTCIHAYKSVFVRVCTHTHIHKFIYIYIYMFRLYRVFYVHVYTHACI